MKEFPGKKNSLGNETQILQLSYHSNFKTVECDIANFFIYI